MRELLLNNGYYLFKKSTCGCDKRAHHYKKEADAHLRKCTTVLIWENKGEWKIKNADGTTQYTGTGTTLLQEKLNELK